MDRQLKRILNLVRRTGDRMIVTDPDGEEAYVIMGLDQYEALLHDHDAFDDFDEDWDPDIEDHLPPPSDWTPEMDGELIPVDQEPLPPVPPVEPVDELRKSVEQDLRIVNTSEEEKKTENSPRNDDPEEQFYLEPIE